MTRTDFLKSLPYFADLPQDEITRLCAALPDRTVTAGGELLSEGAVTDAMFLVVDGEFEVTRQSGGREIVLALLGPGEPVGEIALLEGGAHSATVRAVVDSTVVEIGREVFDELLSNEQVARAMMRTVVGRLRATERSLRQSEKLAALGRLTGGLMHELNNPAAALQRTATRLRDEIAAQRDVVARLAAGEVPDRGAAPDDPLARSDREEEVAAWLRARGIGDAHDLAPALVSGGWDPAGLDGLAGAASDRAVDLVRWLARSYSLADLTGELRVAAGRISELVAAVKRYSYADVAPIQDVDVNAGIRDTLVLLRHTMDDGMDVELDLDEGLPSIEAYGAELNQVWTNLLDNAIDATGGHGRIRIRTCTEGRRVVVEVTDDGPGIAPEDERRIFEPFFTTKRPGEGTGIGLATVYDVVRRHGGDVNVESDGDTTTFRVTLPRSLPTRPA